MSTYAQEWAAEYRRLHALPGRRGPVTLSQQGARILKMLGPLPWEPGRGGLSVSGRRVAWQPEYDERILAQSGPGVGFPHGDRERILRAFRATEGRGGRERQREPGLLREPRRAARRAGAR